MHEKDEGVGTLTAAAAGLREEEGGSGEERTEVTRQEQATEGKG